MLQSGLESARHDGYVFWVPRLLNAIGWLYGEIGALDVALQHDEEAASEAAGQQLTEVRVESRLNLATDCLRLGPLDRAASLLAEADALTRQNVWYVWLRAFTSPPSRLKTRSHGEHPRAPRSSPRKAKNWRAVTACGNTSFSPRACWPRLPRHSATGREPRHISGTRSTSSPRTPSRSLPGESMRRRRESTTIAAVMPRPRSRSSRRDPMFRQLSDRILDEPLKATFLQSHAIGQVGADLGARRDAVTTW